MLSWVAIRKNSLHYKVFRSKHISVGGAQKHLSSANTKQQSRWNISHNMLEHNEKITLKNISLWTM